MVPIAPVFLAVVITFLWSKDMWNQDSSDKSKENDQQQEQSNCTKLVVVLEDNEATVVKVE